MYSVHIIIELSKQGFEGEDQQICLKINENKKLIFYFLQGQHTFKIENTGYLLALLNTILIIIQF